VDKMSRFRNVALLFFMAALTCWLAGPAADAASSLELTNRVTIGNFTVSYPDGWSTPLISRPSLVASFCSPRR
jgi:hypothetical protein